MRRVVLRLALILALAGAGVAAWRYASPSRDASETGGGVLDRIASALGLFGNARAGL